MNFNISDDWKPLDEGDKTETPSGVDEKTETVKHDEITDEVIEPTIDEVQELKETIVIEDKAFSGTYETAKSDMSTEKKDEIQQNFTETTITKTNIEVSAGADLRTMPLEKAKQQVQEKKQILSDMKNQFNSEANKQEIDRILAEVSDTNITSKILDTRTNSTTNTEQHGNRYLIAARILEACIQTLEQLKKQQPEPEITIKIDREKCIIGKSRSYGDMSDDRFFDIQMEVNISTNTETEIINPIIAPEISAETNLITPPTQATENEESDADELGGRLTEETKNQTTPTPSSEELVIEQQTGEQTKPTPEISTETNLITPPTQATENEESESDELGGRWTEETKSSEEEPVISISTPEDKIPEDIIPPNEEIKVEEIDNTKKTKSVTPAAEDIGGRSLEEEANIINTAPITTTFNYKEELDGRTQEREDVEKKIQQLMQENEEIKNIIDMIKNLGINFEQGDDTNINMTAAVLKAIDGDFITGENIILEAQNKAETEISAVIYIIARMEEERIKQSSKTIQNTNQEEEKKINTNFSTNNENLRKTLTPKLEGRIFENLINTVNAIKNEEERITIQKLLEKGLIQQTQEYIGMFKNSEYEDNKATGNIDNNTIKRLAQPKLLETGREIQSRLPSDIQSLYREFLNTTINNNKKSYALISKKNYTLYLFNREHKLLSTHATLLGSQIGDQNAAPEVPTTPGGHYTINAKAKPGEYSGPGDYLQLQPNDRNYNNPNFSIGIHPYPTKNSDRANILESTSANKRISNGCINTLIQGAIYDNLEVGSIVSIAKES